MSQALLQNTQMVTNHHADTWMRDSSVLCIRPIPRSNRMPSTHRKEQINTNSNIKLNRSLTQSHLCTKFWGARVEPEESDCSQTGSTVSLLRRGWGTQRREAYGGGPIQLTLPVPCKANMQTWHYCNRQHCVRTAAITGLYLTNIRNIDAMVNISTTIISMQSTLRQASPSVGNFANNENFHMQSNEQTSAIWDC